MIVVDESQIGGQDVAEKIMAGGDLAKKKLCVAGKMEVFGEKKVMCGGKQWREGVCIDATKFSACTDEIIPDDGQYI